VSTSTQRAAGDAGHGPPRFESVRTSSLPSTMMRSVDLKKVTVRPLVSRQSATILTGTVAMPVIT
jgi:hypothetical protein